MYQKLDTPYACANPILLLSFNRLDTLKRVLQIIESVRPSKIYLANDGARENKIYPNGISEKEQVHSVRNFLIDSISHFDFPCEVKTRFLDSNLGCKKAVSSAISWFFENEEQGIILEDDCLPTLSFFRFCDELLEKYKMQHNVFMISGWSALDFAQNTSVETLSPKARLQEDYYFSKYNHIWGWASWARAWSKYQLEFNESEIKTLHNFCSTKEKHYWYHIFKTYAQGKIDTWDYPWTYNIWKHNGLCIYPKNNMISNIGFNRVDAAHTTGDSKFVSMPSYELCFPLTHPKTIKQNSKLDKANFHIIFNTLPLHKRILVKLKRTYKKYFNLM